MLCTIFLTLPNTTSTLESALSKLPIVKNRLRTMLIRTAWKVYRKGHHHFSKHWRSSVTICTSLRCQAERWIHFHSKQSFCESALRPCNACNQCNIMVWDRQPATEPPSTEENPAGAHHIFPRLSRNREKPTQSLILIFQTRGAFAESNMI